MAFPTFTPPVPPSPGTANKPKVKLLKAEFGDGYTQTTRDGLNHVRRTLSLKWEFLTPTQAKTISAPLAASRGVAAELPLWVSTHFADLAPVRL